MGKQQINDKIRNIIDLILEDSFFQNKVIVRVVVKEINKEILIVDNTESNNPDLLITVDIDENKKITITQNLSSNYLKEFEDIWKKEMLLRGLKYNITDIRKKVIQYFEDIKFNQVKIKDLKLIFEVIFFMHILTQYIFRHGSLPMEVWYNKHPLYRDWEKYITIKPIIAGILDFYIDKIIGILISIHIIYEIVMSDIFSKKNLQEKVSNKIYKKKSESIKKKMLEELIDRDRSEYETINTLFYVSTLLSDDLLESIEETMKMPNEEIFKDEITMLELFV